MPRGLPTTHPGRILPRDALPALGYPPVEVARLLGIPAELLDDILNERTPITPELALRLGKLCGNGPKLWLAQQTRYDLARIRKEKATELAAIPTLATAA
jgi:addiction module HigA family antidote